MVKGGRRRRKGSRGTGNSSDGGSQAAKVSGKKAQKKKGSGSQKGEESVKDVADDQKRKEIASDTTEATPSTGKNVKDDSIKAGEKATSDNKTTEKSAGYESATSSDPKGLVSRRLWPDRTLLACAPPIQDTHEEFCPPVEPLHASKLEDIDERKRMLDPKASKTHPEVFSDIEKTETGPKTEKGESKPLLQDPIMDIDESIRNLDLNASKVQQDPLSQDQTKLNEPQTKECEKIISLERDVNLTFEFDEHGNKRILVGDKDHYVVDEEQNITFNIGDGKTQLSFIGNKVSISTQGGQIDCSMQSNQVVFTRTDSAIKSDPLPEVPRATQVQRRLEDSVTKFTTDIKTVCKDFENSFLKCLK